LQEQHNIPARRAIVKASKIVSAVAALAVFASLTVSSPAEAVSICSLDPDTNYYSWFAHAMGMC
jgi:hypothetical protein